jgi:hypothetical protein
MVPHRSRECRVKILLLESLSILRETFVHEVQQIIGHSIEISDIFFKLLRFYFFGDLMKTLLAFARNLLSLDSRRLVIIGIPAGMDDYITPLFRGTKSTD